MSKASVVCRFRIGKACHSASRTTKVSIMAMIMDEPVITPRKMA